MSLSQDVRYALRTMRQSPGFTAVAILALGLGIGANTAIFSVIDAVLLRALPYKDAGRLVALTRVFPQGRATSTSPPKFLAWKRATADAIEDVAVYDFLGPGVSLSGEGEPEQIKAIHASKDFFSLFGVMPVLGRTFSADEDLPGGPHVAVISYGLWQRRFGADAALIGRPIVLSGEPYTVIGITPRDFEPKPPADIWMPLQLEPNSRMHGHYLLCGGRLKPGVTLAVANERMKAAAEQFRRQFPGVMGDRETAGVLPMQEMIIGNIRPVLLMLLGAVALVLLIACANVANLLLARAAARGKEVAVRTALGAGRARLIRQLLTESVVLAAAGGIFGLLLGHVGLKALVAFSPPEIPRLSEMAARSGLDPRILGFTVALSLVTGILFGLAPAWHVSRADLSSTLKEGSGRTTSGASRHILRSVLVAGEVAIGLVLLIGAGLLVRSAASLRSVQAGFDTEHVLTFKTALTGARFSNTAAVTEFARRVTERLESLPGVQAAGLIINLPTQEGPDLSFRVEGRPADATNANGDEQWRYVSPHAFKAMSIPLLRGRLFDERDNAAGPRVIIVNEAFARKYWPKGDAMGQRITIGGGTGPFADPTREVVGIAGNIRESGLDQNPPPVMYVPQAQVNDGLTALGNGILPVAWVVRTAGNPLALAQTVRREVAAIDSQQALFDFRSMGDVLAKANANRRFVLLLLMVFAGVALLLAAVGIYGVMAYSVEQRSHEIGIRIALGADNGRVVSLVVRNGMMLAGAGLVIGLAGAFGLTRFLSSLLFGVKATDPSTFAGVAAALAAVALAASWIPARRATRVDPIAALRHQ